MKRMIAWILAMGVVVTGWVRAQEPTQAVRLFAEAEDFTIKSGEWQVVPYRENYFASTFAITFLSRHGCLGAPEQVPSNAPAIAEQVVQVPVADSYQLLVRYEQPYQYACEFTVEVEQAGAVTRYVCGRLQDPKIWSMNGHQRVPMERYWWGGTDNILWQNPGAVPLKPGPATIRLIAGSQVDGNRLRINAARRNVDIVVLTNDKEGIEAQKKTSYLEFDGWLVQDGDLFIKITNRGDKPVMPDLVPNPMGQHSPYYIHVRDWPNIKVLKTGRLVSATKYQNAGPRSLAVKASLLAPVLDPAKFQVPVDPTKPQDKMKQEIPEAEQLKPGETSGWVPMGQVLDAMHDSTWSIKAPVPLELEFAVPDGKGGLTSIKKISVTDQATFEMPGNIAPNPVLAKILQERWWSPVIRTQTEALSWLKGEVDKFPKRGPGAKRFLIYSIGGFGSTPSYPEGLALMEALGDNTAHAKFKGMKRQIVAHWPDVSPGYYNAKDMSDIYIVSYGDEMHLPSVALTNTAFAAWLKARGVAFDGTVEWTRDPKHPLYYYSMLAGVEQGAKPYAQATAFYKSKGTLTGANYSPHANYLVSEMHWVRPFKLNALSMAWSEDYVWQIPEFSVQVVGYLTTAFRCGVKYNKQPIHMYVMPHSPGNTPSDFRRSFYTCVAHGTTMINYFCASPLAVGGTENYVATADLKMWRQIHHCSHEAGVFEDYVMDGGVRPAKVGLVLSSVDDVLTGASNSKLAVHNNERKAIYYALRHAQVPVDMVSEDDVIDGRVKDYRVLYVMQQWMHSKGLSALRKWVEAGGTVVALCGGGFLDEFNRPNPEANVFYGVKQQAITTDPKLVSRYLLKENTPFLTKQDLPLYEALDVVSWSQPMAVPGGAPGRIREVPVIVWKQSLEPLDAAVLGTYRDGRPAVVSKVHGKGRVYLFGFLPGQAYLKSGLPIVPPDRGSTDTAAAHQLPNTMDLNLRHRLVDDFLPADFARPVVCSDDLVETTCIDTPTAGKPNKLAVTMINYRGTPVPNLSVAIRGVPAAKAVRSVERGVLKPRFEGDVMYVDLPLDVADMLMVDL